jgi:hypothetical protein
VKVEIVPGKPSRSQRDVLSMAVYAAYEAGWKGNLREKTAPTVARWATKPTRISLRSKNLIEAAGSPRGGLGLTKFGIEAGETAFAADRGESAEQCAQKRREAVQESKQREKDRLDRAKHLFRGFYLTRQASYGGKSKAGRSVVAHLNRGPSIHMSLDDLLALGEQIEALR